MNDKYNETNYSDQFPIRQDLTVIQGDQDPKDFFINWTVNEHIGFEVFRYTDEMKQLFKDGKLTIHQLLDDREWPVDSNNQLVYHKPITIKEDLKPGDSVIVKGNLYDYVHDFGIVREDDTWGLFVNVNEWLMVVLAFGEDDRKCWSATGLINKKAMEKLYFEKDDYRSKS